MGIAIRQGQNHGNGWILGNLRKKSEISRNYIEVGEKKIKINKKYQHILTWY